ncbi:uncharacterized protein [Hyperolius riggenbachi]|uniref:uncharacterized protein isoform X1 n=1 Tax=Hyperolius riggenbachi TaxID=752182 RepID=UPI0035A399E5
MEIHIMTNNNFFMGKITNRHETQPILWFSKEMTPAEKKFARTEQVLACIQYALAKYTDIAGGKDIFIFSSIPELQAATKASVGGAKALHVRWVQWANSLNNEKLHFVYSTHEDYSELPLCVTEEVNVDSFDVIYYTDGSARHALGTQSAYKAAGGFIKGRFFHGQFVEDSKEIKSLGDNTAQNAELKAMEMAVMDATHTKGKILICSDSYYVIESIHNKDTWLNNNFLTCKGVKVKNIDIWRKIFTHMTDNMTFLHVKGHSTEGIHSQGNTFIDEGVQSITRRMTLRSSMQDFEKVIKGEHVKGYPRDFDYVKDKDTLNLLVGTDEGIKTCPPPDHRDEILLKCHTSNTPHLNVQTMNKMLLSYWWPGIKQDVNRTVRSCLTCQKVTTQYKKKGYVGRLEIGKNNLSLLYADHIGPLEPIRGFSYVLTVVDSKSRYLFAFPQKRLTGEKTSELLSQLWSIVPFKKLVTDNGPAFSNKMLRELSSKLGFTLEHSVPNAPETNGMIERFNAELKKTLQKMKLEENSDWLSLLPRAIQYINTRLTSTKDTSSFDSLFLEQYLSHQDVHNHLSFTLGLAKSDLLPPVGSSVLVKNLHKTALEPAWTGPFSVIEHIENKAVIVTDSSGKRRTVFFEHVKPFAS